MSPPVKTWPVVAAVDQCHQILVKGRQWQTHRCAAVTGLQVSVDLFEREKPQDEKTPVSQSRDQHLVKQCHHSISKSDDEQGVFLLCQLSSRLTSFHWHKIDTKKTAHAFQHKPARTLMSFCITPFWELWHSHDEGRAPTSTLFAYCMGCSSVYTRPAMLLFFFSAPLMENRVWWKGEQVKRAKINNLFYLMGWRVVLMRRAGWVEAPIAKIFSRRLHAEIRSVTFSQPLLPWQQSHRDEQSHLWGHASHVKIIETALIMMLMLALLFIVAAFQDPYVKCSSSRKYVRIWLAALFVPLCYFSSAFVCLLWMSGFQQHSTVLLLNWVVKLMNRKWRERDWTLMLVSMPSADVSGRTPKWIFVIRVYRKVTVPFTEFQTSDLALVFHCLCNVCKVMMLHLGNENWKSTQHFCHSVCSGQKSDAKCAFF